MNLKSEQKIWEIGSEFHWSGIPKGPFFKWPEPHIFQASGRIALLRIWQILENNLSKTLFIPDYFCHEITGWLRKNGIVTKRYGDGPHLSGPIWDTLSVSKGDAVLIVNYFGIRDSSAWYRWYEAFDKVTLIEDHSHDPVSDWALNSRADYAFSSIRKTFPVPDGAILWSPQGLPLPKDIKYSDLQGSALKLSAMILKKEYLDGENDSAKVLFRKLQLDGEKILVGSNPVSISPWSEFLLKFGYPVEWRQCREKNVQMLLDLLDSYSFIQPLFTKWPLGHCPFNAVFLFSSKETRDKSKRQLIEKNVYPSVHWLMSNAMLVENQDLSDRILTIPLDHRYDDNDIRRVAAMIKNLQ